MTGILQLAIEAERVANERGWDACDWDNMPGKTAMVFTEFVEAEQAARAVPSYGDIDRFATELADIAIRVIVMLRQLDDSTWKLAEFGPGSRIDKRERHARVISRFERVEILLWPALSYLSAALEYWRKDQRSDVCSCLELSVLEIFRLADAVGVDLAEVIEAKTEENAMRPTRHGKKRTLG